MASSPAQMSETEGFAAVSEGYRNDGIHSPSFCGTSGDSTMSVTLKDVNGTELEGPVGDFAEMQNTKAGISLRDAGAAPSSAKRRSALILSESGLGGARDPAGKGTGPFSEDEANTTETNIEDLPDECLLRILRCLGPVNFWKENLDDGIQAAVRNPLHCALVCKRWCALADFGVDSLHLRSRDEFPHLLKALARWCCLRRLDLGRCSDQYRTASEEKIQNSKDLITVLHTASSLLPCLQHLRFEYHFDNLPDICTQAYSLPHLTALELRCGQLPPLNNRSSEILHTLELTNVEATELQESLGLFTRLESLSIVSNDLISLPTSIGQLSRLTRLLLACWNLGDLPSSISHLTALRVLLLQKSKDSIPYNVHHLMGMKDLRIASIDHFEGLPETVGELQHLVELRLSHGGRSLSELPSWLVNVTGLQILRISRCDSLLRLPADIGAMASLREVELNACGAQIVSLPETFGRLNKLEFLKLCDLPSLATLPETFGRLNKLEVLNLCDLPSLATLPESLGECSSLTVIEIYRCWRLQNLPQGFGRLGLLKELSVHQCSLTSLPSSLGYLPMLRSLSVWDCPSLAEWPGTLRGLTALEKLTISWCKSLVSLPEGLGALGWLQSFIIRGCPLRELPEEIGNLSTLETLEIRKCHSLLSLPPRLAPRFLEITSCRALVYLPLSLGSQSLKIQACRSLRGFPATSGLHAPTLEHIVLSTLLVSLSPTLSSCKSLKSLSLTDCPNVEELPESLGMLTTLENLHLRDLHYLTSLPESLGSLGKLTNLNVSKCPLRELPASVGQLTSLQTLSLLYGSLKSLPQSLEALSNLRRLSVHQTGCNSFQVPDSVRSLGGGHVLKLTIESVYSPQPYRDLFDGSD